MAYVFYLLTALFLLICCILMLLVLIQKGRGGGLASAFGGAGGNTAFGSKTGDVLTWATSVVFGVFLVLAIGLNLVANYNDAARKQAAPAGVAPISSQVPASGGPAAPGGELPTDAAK